MNPAVDADAAADRDVAVLVRHALVGIVLALLVWTGWQQHRALQLLAREVRELRGVVPARRVLIAEQQPIPRATPPALQIPEGAGPSLAPPLAAVIAATSTPAAVSPPPVVRTLAPVVTIAQAPAVPPAEVPTRLRLLVEREAEAVFGLQAPVALFAAQIHQESNWRPEAASKYAQGLAQFTPATSAWMAKLYPLELSPADPWDPAWSVRAQVFYMRDLVRQFAGGATRCDDWAFGLAAYNGGPGWLQRDQRRAAAAGADRTRWFDQVELHTGRGARARTENRSYVRRILQQLEPRYLAAGWTGERTCP